MVRHKWLIQTRNKLANISSEFNSAAAIEGAKMSSSERKFCFDEITKVINFIDKELFK